jgi:Kinesin motor domain
VLQASSPVEGAPTEIRGSQEDGILYSALQQGFVAARRPSGRSCEVSVTVLEVYKERVLDLLHGKKEVLVKHTAQQGFYAHGARKVVCQDFAKAARLCRKALSHRFVQR